MRRYSRSVLNDIPFVGHAHALSTLSQKAEILRNTQSFNGLGSVDNASEPIRMATRNAVNLKANTRDITKSCIGLGNFDDAGDLHEPRRNLTQGALEDVSTNTQRRRSYHF